MKGLFISYVTTAGMVAAGGIVGAILSRVLDKVRNTTPRDDVIQIAVTAVLWPVALPVGFALALDNSINSVYWKVSVNRKSKTEVRTYTVEQVQ